MLILTSCSINVCKVRRHLSLDDSDINDRCRLTACNHQTENVNEVIKKNTSTYHPVRVSRHAQKVMTRKQPTQGITELQQRDDSIFKDNEGLWNVTLFLPCSYHKAVYYAVQDKEY